MKKMIAMLLFLSAATMMSAQEWVRQEVPSLDGKWKLIDIEMLSPDLGWAAGNYYATEGAIMSGTGGLILRYDGKSWNNEPLPPIEGNWWLRSLFFLSGNEGWATGSTGDKGLILHYSGGKWGAESLPAVDCKEWDLHSAFFLPGGEGWAVGGAGQKTALIFHRQNGIWANVSDAGLLAKHTLVSIHGSSGSDIWAGGFKEGEFGKVMMTGQPWGSFLLHYDGKQWTEAEFPLLMRNIIMMDIQAFSEKEAIFTGYNPPFQAARENGKIAIWNGKKWSDAKPPDAAHEWKLYDLAMKDAGNGYAAGEYLERDMGLVLKCDKGTWEVIKEKKLPAVSGKWDFLATDYDGSGGWVFAGWDEQGHKGMIYRMKE